MKRIYFCTTKILKVSGHQTWSVEADSLDEAKQKFKEGESDFECECIGVEKLSDPEWEDD